MRLTWAWILLGAGLLPAGGTAAAREEGGAKPAAIAATADLRPAVPARPGTPEEMSDYGRREAESPGVREFSGGEVIVVVSAGFVFLALLVIIIILLARD